MRGGIAGAQGAKVPFAFLQRVPYKSAAWSKYPDMANILDDEPCTPKCEQKNKHCRNTEDLRSNVVMP